MWPPPRACRVAVSGARTWYAGGVPKANVGGGRHLGTGSRIDALGGFSASLAATTPGMPDTGRLR